MEQSKIIDTLETYHVSTPPSLDLACPQAEADIEKYVHMFRDRGLDKNKIRT